MEPTYQQIKAAFSKKGYSYFDSGNAYNLNIWGVRKQYGEIDRFDDLLGISYKDETGNEVIFSHKATVDPGKHYLLDETLHPKGTFILAPGQYRGCWQKGLHNQQKPSNYPALIQKPNYSGFNGWRDNLLNGKIDRILNSNGAFFNDVTGLNMHRSSYSYATIVGQYSAACQVRQYNSSHQKVMDIIDKSLKYFPNSFSYTLFDEEEVFPEVIIQDQTRGSSINATHKRWPEDYINVEK